MPPLSRIARDILWGRFGVEERQTFNQLRGRFIADCTQPNSIL